MSRSVHKFRYARCYHISGSLCDLESHVLSIAVSDICNSGIHWLAAKVKTRDHDMRSQKPKKTNLKPNLLYKQL
jgi:hypothetical protein